MKTRGELRVRPCSTSTLGMSSPGLCRESAPPARRPATLGSSLTQLPHRRVTSRLTRPSFRARQIVWGCEPENAREDGPRWRPPKCRSRSWPLLEYDAQSPSTPPARRQPGATRHAARVPPPQRSSLHRTPPPHPRPPGVVLPGRAFTWEMNHRGRTRHAHAPDLDWSRFGLDPDPRRAGLEISPAVAGQC